MSYAGLARKMSDAHARGTGMPRSFGGGLRISEPTDVFEQEADRVADEVLADGRATHHWSLRGLASGTPLQRKCSCGGSGGAVGDCEECKQKEGESLQRKAAGPAGSVTAPSVVHGVLNSSGQPLDTTTRDYFEPRFGYDFSRVRIHNDARAAESARAVNALAYTVGSNITIGSNQYAPETERGRRLLAHELVHVIQQSESQGNSASEIHRISSPTIQRVCVGGVTCPAPAVELPAGWPWSEAAEVCIRTDYIRNHGGNSIGSNNTWQFLNMPAGTPAKRDHDCFKSSLMAKSGMFLAQPDIIDFTSAEIYDVTTVSQTQSHRVRVDADTKQATALAATVGCGGSEPPTMRKWSPGVWVPPGCYWIGNDIFLRVENVGGGLLIYHVLKDVKKELVTAVLLATMAALLKGGKGAGPAAATSKVAGRALAYVNLAAIAILLVSGKAEAKTGPGDEMPIETLFKAMDQKGTPVPPELRDSIKAYLDANPDLKAKVEAAAKGGDMSATQQEISKRALEVLRENPEEFSQEDLELMLAANEAGGPAMPASDITASKLRAALDAKKKGQSGGGGQQKENVWERARKGGTGPDTPSDKPSQVPPASSGSPVSSAVKPPNAGKANIWETTTIEADPKLSALSKDSKKKLASAPANVRKLFRALSEGAGSGPQVTDGVVDRYLAIVPSDLTTEQAQALISQLAAATGQTPDQILDSLQKALDEMKKTAAAQDVAAAESDVLTIEPPKAAKPDAQPASDVVKKLADLAGKADFSSVLPGTMLLTWSTKEEAGTMDATLKVMTKEGVRGIGRVKGRITKREGQKLTIQAVTATPVVRADAIILMTADQIVGKSQTYTLIAKPGKK